MQRRKKVEEYEAIIHNLMLETADDCHAAEMEKITESRVCTYAKIHLTACVKCYTI